MTKANKELEDGSFEVRIPLSEKLKGKDLVAYYVDDNGNKEEHEVTIKDGYAVFNTNHFSTYTLAEKPAEKPDKTPDETPIETPDNTPKGDDNTNNENEKDETPKTGVNNVYIAVTLVAISAGSIVLIKKNK